MYSTWPMAWDPCFPMLGVTLPNILIVHPTTIRLLKTVVYRECEEASFRLKQRTLNTEIFNRLFSFPVGSISSLPSLLKPVHLNKLAEEIIKAFYYAYSGAAQRLMVMLREILGVISPLI